jgi:imidazolonepropionase-like amidohydrolase
MRRVALFTLALSAVTATVMGRQAAGPAAPASTAFVGVTVVPMDRDTVLRDQTVVVRDGRIAEIGPAAGVKVPDGATRVDAAGKFLMPALAEMHAHIPGGDAPDGVIENTLLLYAANGLGTIRGMLGHPRHLAYRDRAAKSELVSPRIYTSGPSLNGNSVPDKASAVQAVTSQKEAGYDLLKIHPGLTREVFDAMDAKADELGIPYAGHVPLDVGLHRALEAGYRSIDHLDGYVEALARNPKTSQFFGVNLMGEIDESGLPALVAATKRAGTWQVPTQVLFDNLLGGEEGASLARRPELKYASPKQVEAWLGQTKKMTEIPAADRQKFLALRRRILKALYDAGVPFALGSDAPQIWNVPGFSTHRELQSLVEAGLTPFQALQTGTVNVARYFGTEAEGGTVAAGRRADLVLLDANPLENIANSARIAGVMLNGRWMDRAAIDKRLQAAFPNP